MSNEQFSVFNFCNYVINSWIFLLNWFARLWFTHTSLYLPITHSLFEDIRKLARKFALEG